MRLDLEPGEDHLAEKYDIRNNRGDDDADDDDDEDEYDDEYDDDSDARSDISESAVYERAGGNRSARRASVAEAAAIAMRAKAEFATVVSSVPKRTATSTSASTSTSGRSLERRMSRDVSRSGGLGNVVVGGNSGGVGGSNGVDVDGYDEENDLTAAERAAIDARDLEIDAFTHSRYKIEAPALALGKGSSGTGRRSQGKKNKQGKNKGGAGAGAGDDEGIEMQSPAVKKNTAAVKPTQQDTGTRTRTRSGESGITTTTAGVHKKEEEPQHDGDGAARPVFTKLKSVDLNVEGLEMDGGASAEGKAPPQSQPAAGAGAGAGAEGDATAKESRRRQQPEGVDVTGGRVDMEEAQESLLATHGGKLKCYAPKLFQRIRGLEVCSMTWFMHVVVECKICIVWFGLVVSVHSLYITLNLLHEPVCTIITRSCSPSSTDPILPHRASTRCRTARRFPGTRPT